MTKYNKKNPPMWGKLTPAQFATQVDDKSFPRCGVCGCRIYNPEFYPENNIEADGMCGPCCTGESRTLMK